MKINEKEIDLIVSDVNEVKSSLAIAREMFNGNEIFLEKINFNLLNVPSSISRLSERISNLRGQYFPWEDSSFFKSWCGMGDDMIKNIRKKEIKSLRENFPAKHAAACTKLLFIKLGVKSLDEIIDFCSTHFEEARTLYYQMRLISDIYFSREKNREVNIYLTACPFSRDGYISDEIAKQFVKVAHQKITGGLVLHKSLDHVEKRMFFKKSNSIKKEE